MSDEDLKEWHEEHKRRDQAVPRDSIRITRDKAWMMVEGYVNDRKVGFRATQDEFEKFDEATLKDYLIGIREKLDERR